MELKCRDEDPPSCDFEFKFSIGNASQKGHRPRGPVTHNFAKRPTAGLIQEHEMWSFLDAEEQGVVYVNVEIYEKASAAPLLDDSSASYLTESVSHEAAGVDSQRSSTHAEQLAPNHVSVEMQTRVSTAIS